MFQNSRIGVHIHPGSQDAANLMFATMKKAKERKFCGHSVDGLKEANCNPDVRSARSIVDQHRIPADEFFQVCDSNLQEEVKSLLTNHIIAPMENVLCVSCGVIRDFHGDPTKLCTACNTSHRTSNLI